MPERQHSLFLAHLEEFCGSERSEEFCIFVVLLMCGIYALVLSDSEKDWLADPKKRYTARRR